MRKDPLEHALSRGEFIEECTSTNDLLKSRGESGAETGTWVCAQRQTAGRGRMGRSWVSETGNIYFSYLTRKIDRSFWTWVPLTSVVALTDVLGSIGSASDEILIKWPNDLWWREKKLAGFLCELSSGAHPFLIVGLGLNLAQAPPGAVSLSEIFTELPSLQELVGQYVVSLEKNLTLLHEQGPEAIAERWSAKSLFRLGDEVTWFSGATQLKGSFQGLGLHGELKVKTESQGVQALFAEDVSLLRKA